MSSKIKKKLSTLIGSPEGLTPLVRKAAWQVHRDLPKQLPERSVDGEKTRRVGRPKVYPKEVQMEIAKDRAKGSTIASLATKYGASITYVEDALRTIFRTSKEGREILKGVILENGIAAGMHARRTIGELTPMQAVVATGIMSSKFVELEKHAATLPSEVDFGELQSIGDNLRQITEQLGEMPDDEGGEVIDID